MEARRQTGRVIMDGDSLLQAHDKTANLRKHLPVKDELVAPMEWLPHLVSLETMEVIVGRMIAAKGKAMTRMMMLGRLKEGRIRVVARARALRVRTRRHRPNQRVVAGRLHRAAHRCTLHLLSTSRKVCMEALHNPRAQLQDLVARDLYCRVR